MGEGLELGTGRHIGPSRDVGQQIQYGVDTEVVDERCMRLSQQVGGDRPGRLLRPVGHLLTPLPQCAPGVGQRFTGDRDRCAIRAAEQQQAHGQWVGDLRYEYVRKIRGEKVTGVWDTIVQRRRTDLPHIDPDPTHGVVRVGALGDHVYVGGAAECPVRMVA